MKAFLLTTIALLTIHCAAAGETVRSLRFQADSPAEAQAWQRAARQKLFELMMGGREPERVPLDPKVVRRIDVSGATYRLEEITMQTLPDRRAHVWLARPLQPRGKVGAVLALNGHGGSGEQIIRGSGLYWYGRAIAEMGYVVVAPDIGQHDLQHTNWTLMGERTWDALRSLDFAATLPEVDASRLAVAGLSLGGETTMYVAALDERVRLACSSGWLTTVANMKNGHCRCYDFPGLEAHFDFSDIFSCVAPRAMVCELGEQERAPGGFPVPIGRKAIEEIRAAYRVFNAEQNLRLTVHPGPHVFNGGEFFPKLRAALGEVHPPLPDNASAVAWVRFTNAPEALDGTPYFWLANGDLQLTFDIPPRPGDSIELGWGGKSDVRGALLVINGKEVAVTDGGHWGFRWVRLHVPQGIVGDRYEVSIKSGQGRPAFLSEARLVRPGTASDRPPITQPAYRANLRFTIPGGAPGAAAFPERHPFWDTPSTGMNFPKGDSLAESAFREAEVNSRAANEALYRSRRYIDGWLAHADPGSGLIPRNLRESRDFWNGRDSAADNYPYMVLTAAITDPPLLRGRLLDMLRTETRLTSRLGKLPDDYSFSKKGWRRPEIQLNELMFDGAEYVKDGLLPITEWLGPSPWSERMIGIIDDLWKHAPIDTPFGKLPTLNFEVGGDLLQACSRLYWFTGDRKYLDWGFRLGDYFLLGTNHPTRDLNQLRLVDHGCEVINGLTELYVAAAHAAPDKKRAYQQPLHAMFDCILEKGRNEDGLLYSWFNPKTGEHSKDLCDTWGYDYDGFYTVWLIDRTESYRDAVRKALSNLKGKYVGACWAEKNADSYADSIEGAINLINREPVASAADWIDSQIRMMWAIQKPDGIVEGWHGDGNFARTSLMYALWKSQGTTVQPWRSDVRLGAVRREGRLFLCLVSEQPWEGRLVFDRPRHRDWMRLPLDYARINQFPEWFTPQSEKRYQLDSPQIGHLEKTGAQLIEGVDVKLQAGEPLFLEVR